MNIPVASWLLARRLVVLSYAEEAGETGQADRRGIEMANECRAAAVEDHTDDSAPLFSVDGTTTRVPVVDYRIEGGFEVPRVTVQVLRVVLAALTETGVVSTFQVQDAPDSPVTFTLIDGRTATLRPRLDSAYMVGELAEYMTVIR